MNGPGSIILTATNNTYSGGTNIVGGVLNIGDGSTSPARCRAMSS